MKFKFFNKNKDKPDLLEEDTNPTLKYFFKLLFRKFSKLVTLNLMMLFQILPLICIFLIYFFASKTYSQISPEFASLLGVHTISNSAGASILFELNLAQLGSPLIKDYELAIIMGLGAFLLITWGLQNTGSTYVLREMVTGKPAFVWSDYFHAVKRNFKQSFWFGIFDALIITVLAIDFVHLYYSDSGFFESFLFFMICGIIILYSIMRMYFYLMIVTFDMSFKKLLKNALIFAILGIKRNIMAALGVVALIALNVFLIALLLPYGVAIPIILPFLYLLSVTAFICAYAAFPVIKKYMIDPYDNENEEHISDGEEEPDTVE